MADKITKTRPQLLQEFEALPDSALVDEVMAAAFRGCSVARMQRDRWAGTGPEYVRDGRSIRYRKISLIQYAEAGVVKPVAA